MDARKPDRAADHVGLRLEGKPAEAAAGRRLARPAQRSVSRSDEVSAASEPSIFKVGR